MKNCIAQKSRITITMCGVTTLQMKAAPTLQIILPCTQKENLQYLPSHTPTDAFQSTPDSSPWWCGGGRAQEEYPHGLGLVKPHLRMTSWIGEHNTQGIPWTFLRSSPSSVFSSSLLQLNKPLQHLIHANYLRSKCIQNCYNLVGTCHNVSCWHPISVAIIPNALGVGGPAHYGLQWHIQ